MSNEVTPSDPNDLVQLFAGKVNIVDFHAEWCGPCKILGPKLDELAKEKESQGVRLYKVNVDNCPDVSEHFRVTAMPTVIIFKGKTLTPAATVVGNNLGKVTEELEKVLSS